MRNLQEKRYNVLSFNIPDEYITYHFTIVKRILIKLDDDDHIILESFFFFFKLNWYDINKFV